MKILLTLLLACFISQTVYSQDAEIDERAIIKEVAENKKYGRKKKFNVKVGSVANEYAYIAQLTGPNGEEISAARLGSCCMVKSPNAPMGKAPLDMWSITYEGLEEPIVIYLNGYDYEPPKCPVGLNFRKLKK